MSGPQFCYVVMAHDPRGIERLISRIRALSPAAAVAVRFEDGQPFDQDRLCALGSTPLVSGIRARWGSWELAEAMLEALARAQAATGADYYVLVSGQDYPVRNLRTWEAEIAAASPDAVIDPIVDHPDDWRFRWMFVTPPVPGHPFALRLTRHGAWRLGTMTSRVLRIHPRFADGDRRWLVGIARPWARPPFEWPVRKASQWMTLSTSAVDHLLSTHRHHPEVARWFRTVRIPDESYAQTILQASDLRIEHGSTTVKKFPPGVASPMWLDAHTLELIASASRAPFARKFAPDVAEQVIAVADRLAADDLTARTEAVTPPRS